MLTDGFNSYTYDAENRISRVSSGSTTYEYDAEGRRVRKTVGGASTDYVYDLSGQEVAEVNGTGVWNRGEVFAGGRHLATYANGTTYFDHEDWLGTERVRTAVNASVCESIASLPFGDGESTTGSCAGASTRHFTGKERDSESGLDNFGARYDSSQMGRFMSPDPSDALVLKAINPQRWNGYAYALNSPLSYTDPTGQDAAAVNFSGMVAGQGHEALLIIDKDGSTTFASFGPTNHGLSNWGGANGSGLVTIASSSGAQSQLPKVQFGANGLPTADSYKALVNKLAALENVDPKTVRLNYFQTSEADTQALKAWVTEAQQNAAAGIDPDAWYNVCFQNCADFTIAGLLSGNALSLQQVKSLSMGFRPNSLFNELKSFENDEFDLMEIQKQKACVTIFDKNGPETTCAYD
ncbi:MAG: RHS repeat domain-containing protein [Candidatus Acidiferrales bacterium]